MPSALPTRPIDATLSVTKAARLLGVHPNTVRAWSDAGRLRYYRINPRGDRRYRVGDLQHFLAAAESSADAGSGHGATTAGHATGAGHRRGSLVADRSAEAASNPDGDRSRRRADLGAMAALGRIAGDSEALDNLLRRAAVIVRERGRFRSVTIHELRAERLVPRAAAAPANTRLPDLPRSFGAFGVALDRAAAGEPGPVEDPAFDGIVPSASAPGARAIAIAIPGDGLAWGVLAIAADLQADPTGLDPDFLVEVAGAVGLIVSSAGRADEIAHRLHRADALRRVASDIGSRLDLDRILAGLVDHAMVLFNGDRAAVFLRGADGRVNAEVSRGLSASYLEAVAGSHGQSLSALAASARRPLYATRYADDPRGASVRAAVVQEGFDTICTAPLLDAEEVRGLLNVYHDEPHEWTSDELETMAALADQAAVAIKNAQNFEKMATWAAQL